MIKIAISINSRGIVFFCYCVQNVNGRRYMSGGGMTSQECSTGLGIKLVCHLEDDRGQPGLLGA